MIDPKKIGVVFIPWGGKELFKIKKPARKVKSKAKKPLGWKSPYLPTKTNEKE